MTPQLAHEAAALDAESAARQHADAQGQARAKAHRASPAPAVTALPAGRK